MASLFNFESLIALVTLTLMEIVLGIDNIVFITILVAKLPAKLQDKARRLGISLALITRLALLFSISWVVGLTQPLFEVVGRGISGRDLILLGGGLFLIGKATFEIHEKLDSGSDEGPEAEKRGKSKVSFGSTIVQIIFLDIVFSLDSVITAVGMAQQISVMVIAMVLAVGVMLISAGSIGSFIQRHPAVKILALSFLLLIGVMLFAEGTGAHVNKGYIYFAMAFAFSIEMINIRYRKKHEPVALHQAKMPGAGKRK
jgi:predicted tellurium resistance membrane protein TerC